MEIVAHIEKDLIPNCMELYGSLEIMLRINWKKNDDVFLGGTKYCHHICY